MRGGSCLALSSVPERLSGVVCFALREVVRRSGGLTSVPIEARIDCASLVRRIKLLLDYQRLPGSDQGMTVDMTEDIYDFGTKVDAAPPPAGEVYDITKLAAQGIEDNGVGG